MSFRESFRSVRATSGAATRVGLPIILLVAVAMYVTWRFIEPAPPAKVVIASGAAGGEYDRVARQYAKYFADNGFDLEVKSTAGSIENYRLLMDEKSGVDLAIVQGGTTPPEASETLQALCSVYLEPLWVFYRSADKVGLLSEFAGKRLAIGPEGSGARALALKLLEANGIDGKSPGKTELRDLGGAAAADALLAGQVDAIFLVIAPESDVVQKLMRDPQIRLMNFEQSKAYSRRFGYLSSVTLYNGIMDLGKDLPVDDIQLVAPTAMLVARKSCHHGTIELVIGAAKSVHAGGTILSAPGQFPSDLLTDLPVGSDAKYYLKTTPSRLLGGLPFWAKSLIDRLALLLIPLIAVLLPLMRFAPALFKWSVRSRITRYYNRLKTVEDHLEAAPDATVLQSDLENLDKLEHKLATMTIPAGYMPDLYDLRLHLDRLRERVKKRMPPTPHPQKA